MHAWQEIAPRYGLEQRHHGRTTPSKNATDIALVVDAMDILYSGAIEHFCLVASDSDYTPLVLRLRSAGCQMLGIGKPTTPLALQTACTEFVSTDRAAVKTGATFPRCKALSDTGSGERCVGSRCIPTRRRGIGDDCASFIHTAIGPARESL